MAAVAISLLGGARRSFPTGFAAVASTAVTITRPAQAVLASSPHAGRRAHRLQRHRLWIESDCLLVPPSALTGVVLALSTPGVVFAIGSGVSLVAGIAVFGLVNRTTPAARGRGSSMRDTVAELVAGLRAVREARAVRVPRCSWERSMWSSGRFDVLAVALAIDVLGLGDSGAGDLHAAFGGRR